MMTDLQRWAKLNGLAIWRGKPVEALTDQEIRDAYDFIWEMGGPRYLGMPK